MKVAVTMGDPYGIGAEVVAKALSRLSAKCQRRCIVIGNKEILEYWGVPKLVDIFDPYPNLTIAYDRPYKTAYAKAALSYIDTAIRLAKAGQVQAIVTGPVNKEALNKITAFIGHTEHLMRAFGVKKVEMIFASKQFNLILATRHLPLKKVPKAITHRRLVEVITAADEFRRTIGSPGPIGVCGLNPHAGEGGLMGDEEINLLIPAIKSMQAKGIPVEGPYPADTIFLERKRFSIIVAMYHDQGLAVLKTLAMKSAVNLTWGLPVLRTSPSHGTAFDIRGKGVADPSSMYAAIRLAFRMVV